MSDSPTETQAVPTGYEIVADLLQRQEKILDELDELNTRVEATIKQISEARQIEARAEQDSAQLDPIADTKAA